MLKKHRQIFLLIILIVLLFLINYPFLDKKLEGFLIEGQEAFVEKVIDGDTIVIENGVSVRLLGVNSPERGEAYHDKAKGFLEDIVLNKSIFLRFGKEKYDRYNRTLAYIFYNGRNINLELVEEGFANFYFPSGKDAYYKNFKNVWEKCLEKSKNLCEKSEKVCAACLELGEFNHKEQRVIFHNTCNFDCDLEGWEIKDEGRKKFVFPKFTLGKGEKVEVRVGEGTNTGDIFFWKNEKYIWTKTGDTLFLRDKEGKLVIWGNY